MTIPASEDISTFTVGRCESIAVACRDLADEYQRRGYYSEAKDMRAEAAWWADQAKAKDRSHE
jgi:hypothetical protein